MRLVNQVIEDINKAKKINLILTGGNSPLKFYDKLFRSKVNWKKVNLFMTDERAVNIKSKNSNYKKINSILSKNNLSEKLKPLEMKSSKSKLPNL
jgi:6-phosphogluconolactonase/glucosamine-6-phosphate isomerase/deaminase